MGRNGEKAHPGRSGAQIYLRQRLERIWETHRPLISLVWAIKVNFWVLGRTPSLEQVGRSCSGCRGILRKNLQNSRPRIKQEVVASKGIWRLCYPEVNHSNNSDDKIKPSSALDEIDSIFNTIDPMAEEACPFPDSNTIHLSLPCSFTHSIRHSIKKIETC